MRLYAALTLAAVIYCVPLFGGLDQYGRSDWDQFTFRYETTRLALVRDHQLPLWNPYVNGGTVLLAHPDVPFPSPWYLIVLALGAPLGLRVQVVVFMALGAVGMARVLRGQGASCAGAFAAGVVFMMSAHFALHIAEGHLEWCVLGLMPWVFGFLWRYRESLRWVWPSALLLASVLTFGSVYIMAIFVPFFGVWAVGESWRTRSWRPAVGWAVVLALTAGVSAVKLLPQLEFVRAYPRQVTSAGLSPAGVVPMFLESDQARLYRATHEAENVDAGGVAESMPLEESQQVLSRLGALGVDHEWHEYGGYVTLAGLGLAVIGVLVSWRTLWPLYVAGAGAMLIVFGDRGPVDLFGALHRLPLYASLQTPSRFLAGVVFAVAVAAGHGLSWVGAAVSKRQAWGARWVAPALAGVVLLELTVMGWALFGNVFVMPPIPLPAHESFATRYAEVTTHAPVMNSYLMPVLGSQSGVLEGYENVQVSQGLVRTTADPAYRGEVYFAETSRTVGVEHWTMSQVLVAVGEGDGDTLVLNQNFSLGWQARIGSGTAERVVAARANTDGLVSVALRSDDREVLLFYRPVSVNVGLGLSVLTLLVLAGGWWGTGRRRYRTPAA